MSKITHNGHTYVGNNEDAWGLNPRIRFEKGDFDSFGVAYFVHRDDVFQGAINEFGLIFDVFSLPIKVNHSREMPPVSKNRDALIIEIMKTCATVEEVRKTIEQRNVTFFPGGMMWFIDQYGHHLIVEPDTLLSGTDARYILTNFRPSETKHEDVKSERFQNARAILNQKISDGRQHCQQLMKTMHACRKKLGEGTLYTSVFDLHQRKLHLFFYHDFEHEVVIDLKKELAKGNHTILFTDIFPPNAEYNRLKAYKTPFNSETIFWALISTLGIAFTASVYFFFRIIMRWIRRRKAQLKSMTPLFLLLILANILLFLLIPILILREPVFYFGFEGQLANFPLPELIYFLPLTIGILLVAGGGLSYQYMRQNSGVIFSKWVISSNLFVLFGILILTIYWGLLLP